MDLETSQKLLSDARTLLLPLEWLDDRGRECAWCGATRHTFNKVEDIGTPREHKARDNHRPDCRWLTFIKATENLSSKF